MKSRLKPLGVRAYWAGQARAHGQSPAASWSDHPVIGMEIDRMASYLQDGDRVLDVGCANGYSSVELASRRRVALRGVDYVPEMIRQARIRARQARARLKGTVEFDCDDLLNLREPAAAYDKVVVTRVLINLGTWPRQQRGLRRCVRVLKPGGWLLLSEATVQGWKRLNRFRKEWGLSAIPMPPFNRYLDRDRVVRFLAPWARLERIEDFASTYYVGTRVLKPLLSRALGGAVDVADPDQEWNRFFSRLPAWGDYGVQKLFVFRKQVHGARARIHIERNDEAT